MAHEAKEIKFLATPEKGEVSALLVQPAVAAAQRAVLDLPVLAGGHSFGGRMTSLAASE